MSNTPAGSFLSLISPRTIRDRATRRKPTRLTGDLAKDETIAASGSESEIIDATGTATNAPGAATEGTATLDLSGDEKVSITLAETGTSDPFDIDFVDVYLR